ncbi:MAG TPA: hypothetical protein VF746_03225 [Longimicrobium sp.]
MRDDPAHFGPLKEGGEAVARQAAVLGAKAYHSRVAEGEPKVGAALLDQVLTDRLQAVRGIDREQVRATWDALTRAYGPDQAAGLFTRRSRDVLGEGVSPPEAEQLARFAAARDHLRVRAGLVQPPADERSAPLPRSLEEAAGDLSQNLRERLLAASDGLRKRLAGAYEHPLAAEARLHQMVDERGMDAIGFVRRDPTVLGPLREDLPGGAAQARELARSATDYASTAYGYHRVRGAEEAERLQAQDALAEARLGARDAERAMEGIQAAVQLRGPELEAHLNRQRDRGVGHGEPGPGGPAPDAPGPRPEGKGRAPGGVEDGTPGGANGPVSTGDPSVDAAVQAHVELEEARELTKRLRTLRGERRKAEEKLAELKEQDDTLARARRDFRAVAAEVYRDPDGAIRRWQEAVAADGLERARARLQKDPALLGELRTEGEPGPFRRAAQAAARAWRGSAGGEEAAGDDARSRLAARAEAFGKAESATRREVEWTTPDGEKVVGREKVREAAQGVYEGRQREIDAGEKRLKALGGVEGAEKAAQQTLEVLSPEQKQVAMRQITGITGASALHVAAGMARATVEAARVARTLREGPAGL